MIGAKVYNYLTELLAAGIEADFAASTPNKSAKKNTYSHYGVYHKRINNKGVATMSHLFEKNICRADKPAVLADADGCLYAFNGEFYDFVGSGMSFITELIKRTMSRLKIADQYIFYAPQYIAKEVYRTLTNSDEYIYMPNRRYIAFKNGVLDIEHGSLKAFDMRYATDIILDIDYMDIKTLYKDCADRFGIGREENPCKLWEWKVEEIIPEKEMRKAFQMFCGSLLLNREVCKVEYVCYLIGSGSNGKSVLASVIAGVFGERYFSRFSPKQLFKDSDARVNIAALRGKIANLVGDLDEKDISGGDFKRFASGEKFQGRENYARKPIQVTAPPLLCCANSMPETSDDSWGHHRRQLPIYTTTKQWTEKDKDPYLTQKLTTPEARQRVFLWIYEGYKKIIRNNGNIVLGDSVLRAQARLQERSNSVRRWWDDSEYCKPESEQEGEWIPLKELVAEYQAYCEEMLDTPRKHTDVSAMLRAKGLGNKRTGVGWQFLVGRKTIENDN